MIARLRHRTRLALVSAVTAGILLAAVFAAVVFAFRASERQSAEEVVMPAMNQLMDEISEDPNRPALREVAESYPMVSAAVYQLDGQLIGREGAIQLPFECREGRATVDGVSAIVRVEQGKGIRVLVAVPWYSFSANVRRLTILLGLLWLPLTACAALATWRASRETFRPLDELTQQAEAMTEGDLSRRLTLASQDEYGAFAASLNRFLAIIEESVKREERFIGDAAHELRTPLTVLRGRIETTLQREREPQEYRETLKTALYEAERLSALVEALLQSAAPISDSQERLDIETACEKSHARWVDRYTNAGVHLLLEIEACNCAISEAEMEVILDNLLGNALRISPPDSTCRIVATPNEKGAVVFVEDEGPGVANELKERIFDRFARGEQSRNRMLGGFGIGLAVCRRLLRRRGGDIWVEDNPKGGAKFVVQLN